MTDILPTQKDAASNLGRFTPAKPAVYTPTQWGAPIKQSGPGIDITYVAAGGFRAYLDTMTSIPVDIMGTKSLMELLSRRMAKWETQNDAENNADYAGGYATAVIAALALPSGKVGAVTKGARFVQKAFPFGKGGNHVFWSGGREAMDAAMAYATANGAKTLEMTLVGRLLQNVVPKRVANHLWDPASAWFATMARGDAHVFIGNQFRGGASIFGRIEGPILNFKGNRIIQHFKDVW